MGGTKYSQIFSKCPPRNLKYIRGGGYSNILFRPPRVLKYSLSAPLGTQIFSLGPPGYSNILSRPLRVLKYSLSALLGTQIFSFGLPGYPNILKWPPWVFKYSLSAPLGTQIYPGGGYSNKGGTDLIPQPLFLRIFENGGYQIFSNILKMSPP